MIEGQIVVAAYIGWCLFVAGLAWTLYNRQPNPPRYPQLRVNVKEPPKPAPNLTPDVVLTWDKAAEIQSRLLSIGQASLAKIINDAMRRAREGR